MSRSRFMAGQIAGAIALGLLGGCQVFITGHNADRTLLMNGQGGINVATEEGYFDTKFEPLNMTCKGETKVVYKPPGGGPIGNKAALTATCSDGRTGKGELVVKDWSGGDGWAEDECGNRVTFLWSTTEPPIAEAAEENRLAYEKASAAKGEFIDRCDMQGDAPPHRDPLI